MEIGRNRNRETSDITNTTAALDEEKKILNTIEKWFHNTVMERLETLIPRVMKQDLNYLKGIIDTAGTGVKRVSNRLLAEALRDLFKKYAAGEGEHKLSEKPDYKGEY